MWCYPLTYHYLLRNDSSSEYENEKMWNTRSNAYFSTLKLGQNFEEEPNVGWIAGNSRTAVRVQRHLAIAKSIKKTELETMRQCDDVMISTGLEISEHACENCGFDSWWDVRNIGQIFLS